MSYWLITESGQTLTTEVSATSRHEDEQRGTKISRFKLDVRQSSSSSRPPRFSCEVRGLPFEETGEVCCAWQFIPHPTSIMAPTLRLVLARGAYIPNIERVIRQAAVLSAPLPGRGWHTTPRVVLEIVRKERTRLGVALGDPVPVMSGSMAPTPWTSAAAQLINPATPTTPDWRHLGQEEHAPLVSELPDGLLIEKSAHGGLPAWQIRIRVPLDQPAAYAYNLFGPNPPPSGGDAIPEYDREYLTPGHGLYVLRVVATSNVDIEASIESPTTVTAADFRIETHIVDGPAARRTHTVEDDLIGLGPMPLENREGWHHIGLVPPQGSYLNPMHFQFRLASHQIEADVPVHAGEWTAESLAARQVAGDRIAIRGRQQGNLLARFSPRVSLHFTAALQAEIAVFEFAIGMLPLVGTLYDIAGAIYIQSTGRSWWGDRRELGWMDLLGIGAIGFGILDDLASASRQFSRAFETFERVASSPPLMRSIARQIDPPLRPQFDIAPPTSRHAAEEATEAVTAGRAARPRVQEAPGADPSIYSTRGREVLAQAAARARAVAGRTARDVGRMIDELDLHAFQIISDELLNEAADVRHAVLNALTRTQVIEALLRVSSETLERILRQHERVRLLRVLSPDFRSFNNQLLHRGYLAYLSKRAARGEGTISAITWLSWQTTGTYAEELRRILGRGFGARIRSGAARGLGSDLDEAALRIFNDLQNQIVPYTDLVRLRTASATPTLDPGAFWDADHLLEKRFIHSLRDRITAFDTGSLSALLVPKHQGILARMQEVSPTRIVTYDHSTKTQLMRALIPYTEPDRFSLQQWWDAHVFVYLQLPVPNRDPVLAALRRDFDRLAEALGESYTARLVYHDLNLVPRDMSDWARDIGPQPE